MATAVLVSQGCATAHRIGAAGTCRVCREFLLAGPWIQSGHAHCRSRYAQQLGASLQDSDPGSPRVATQRLQPYAYSTLRCLERRPARPLSVRFSRRPVAAHSGRASRGGRDSGGRPPGPRAILWRGLLSLRPLIFHSPQCQFACLRPATLLRQTSGRGAGPPSVMAGAHRDCVGSRLPLARFFTRAAAWRRHDRAGTTDKSRCQVDRYECPEQTLRKQSRPESARAAVPNRRITAPYSPCHWN